MLIFVNQMMEMTQLGDAVIGDLESGYGISVEERKRLTIGMELVAKPHILFLDGIAPLLFFTPTLTSLLLGDPLTLNFRTNIWARFSILLQHHQVYPQASRRRHAPSVHHSSTVLCAV